jgi:hypothetical protein
MINQVNGVVSAERRREIHKDRDRDGTTRFVTFNSRARAISSNPNVGVG